MTQGRLDSVMVATAGINRSDGAPDKPRGKNHRLGFPQVGEFLRHHDEVGDEEYGKCAVTDCSASYNFV